MSERKGSGDTCVDISYVMCVSRFGPWSFTEVSISVMMNWVFSICSWKQY